MTTDLEEEIRVFVPENIEEMSREKLCNQVHHAFDIIKELTKQIREVKNESDIMFEKSPLGIVLSKNQRFIRMNESFYSIMGFAENELLNETVEKITYQKDLENSMANIRKMKAGDLNFYKIKKRYQRKDGSLFLAHTHVSVIYDEDNNPKYNVAIIEDITEQALLEKQKDILLNNLEKNNKELREYAHLVSHDLKSPLRAVYTMLQWLKDDLYEKVDDSSMQFFDRIEAKLSMTEELINGILEYSNLDRMEEQKFDVDVQGLVEEIATDLNKGKNISFYFDSKLPNLFADGNQIKLMFSHALDNAIKYVDQNTGEIHITCEETKKEWVFRVKDNGIGIDSKYHTKIFEIFQTLQPERKSPGVGLSVIKKICELYEGQASIDSELGKGTCLTMTFSKHAVDPNLKQVNLLEGILE